MTTSTRCRNCAHRCQGVVVVCPKCGSDRMEAWQTLEALPMTEAAIPQPRSRQPQGCYCGLCEENERSLTTRCPGPALAMRMRRRHQIARP